MLTLRPTQFSALAVDVRRRLLESALDLVRRCWSRKYAIAGEGETRRLVEAAVADAETHGFVDERHVLRYVNVVMALGRDFGEDSRHEAAAALLARRDLPAEARIELLSTAVFEALAARVGE